MDYHTKLSIISELISNGMLSNNEAMELFLCDDIDYEIRLVKIRATKLGNLFYAKEKEAK